MTTRHSAAGGQGASDRLSPAVIPIEALATTSHAREFVGAEHGNVPFSIILVQAPPGVGPRLHRHPYPEVFIVEAGRARFRLGEDEVEVESGHVVIAQSGAAHGFVNSGSDELRLIAIHGSGRFETEWLAGLDPAWTSKPPR